MFTRAPWSHYPPQSRRLFALGDGDGCGCGGGGGGGGAAAAGGCVSVGEDEVHPDGSRHCQYRELASEALRRSIIRRHTAGFFGAARTRRLRTMRKRMQDARQFPPFYVS
jgi:hypothetical protein